MLDCYLLINLEYRGGTKDQDNEKKKKTQLSDSIVAEITHIHVACDEERGREMTTVSPHRPQDCGRV